MKYFSLGTLILPAAFVASNVHAELFNRIASFPVAANLPAEHIEKESSAEIISATADGNTLVYSDSPFESIGLVDISNPSAPKPAGSIKLDGEPTAVVVAGTIAYAAINTSADYIDTSGKLVAIDIETASIVDECALDGQPDSIAINATGDRLAVAIENERDEDLNDGVIPQLPAGNVLLLNVASTVIDCESIVAIDVSNRSSLAPTDPEPEFVDFNIDNQLVVSLQENNHFVVIDSTSNTVTASIDAGFVSLENVDVREERALTFDGVQANRAREPDAVQWLDANRFVSANEGDYEGGSRGFTIFNTKGEVLYESNLDFEYRVAMAGHYPERRSGNKGVEPEGLEVATFGDDTYIFVLAERSSVIGVYKDTGAEPEFVQLLPTALGPESAIAIASRNLLAVANEVDLIEDGGVRSYVTLYELGASRADYPMLVSSMVDGKPIGWGALSGLAADTEKPGILYAINDSFYAMQPRIFTIDTNETPARIINALDVTRGGASAQLMDLEGIVADGEGGFWLASEGRPERLIPHAIYHVSGDGEIEQQIPFPKSLLAVEKRFASEGITLIDGTLWISIQRSWDDDPENHVKLVSYNIEEKSWGAVQYPLEPASSGWHGLSEITASGDYVYIVERDNQIGVNAKHKKLYRVAISELTPAEIGTDLPVVRKEMVRDFMPDLLSTNGYVLDKIEGFAIDVDGKAFAVTDNDGVDDSNGETLFLRLGEIASQL